MKADEQRLLEGIKAGNYPRDFIGAHPKRVHYILEKWSGKGWWDYGICAEGGWFTPEAPKEWETVPFNRNRRRP